MSDVSNVIYSIIVLLPERVTIKAKSYVSKRICTGTSYIPPQYQPHLKCIVELEGVESEDDAPDTAYYQWVTFFMAIQAGAFYAPYYIWSILEAGQYIFHTL